MMITGDYHHTAIAVARDVGMLKQEDHVVLIDSHKQPELHPNVAAVPCTTGIPSLRFQVSAAFVASKTSLYGTPFAASGQYRCRMRTFTQSPARTNSLYMWSHLQ